MEELYEVHIKTDEVGKIIAVNSNAFLTDFDGWHKIDEGSGDKYHHAQNHYFEKGLFDKNGCHNYKIEGNIVTECTEQEKEEELKSRPSYPISPSNTERLDALEQAMLALMMGGAANA